MKHIPFPFVAITGIALALASSGLAQKQGGSPILPDAKITPGDTLDVTKEDVCVPGKASAGAKRAMSG